jgi:hypothetical protein
VADELIRDLGTSEQRAYLLIREGKIAEAMRMIKKILASAPRFTAIYAV